MVVFIANHVGNSDFENDFWFTLTVLVLTQILWSYVLVLRTQSIAATAGLHWANNVFVSLFSFIAPCRESTWRSPLSPSRPPEGRQPSA